MTGFTASWRNANPLAAPKAIFILVNQGKGITPSAKVQIKLNPDNFVKS